LPIHLRLAVSASARARALVVEFVEDLLAGGGGGKKQGQQLRSNRRRESIATARARSAPIVPAEERERERGSYREGNVGATASGSWLPFQIMVFGCASRVLRAMACYFGRRHGAQWAKRYY